MNIYEQLAEPGNRAIVGTQFGDEGKGKGVNSSNTDMYGRGNGGRNAGHTFVADNGAEINTHLLPSAINIAGKLNIIGHGTYVDPVGLWEEIEDVQRAGFEVTPDNLIISDRAHLVMPHHIALDGLRERGNKGQGSTKRGIAFVAADKMKRTNPRVSEILGSLPAVLEDMASDGLAQPIVEEVSPNVFDVRRIEPDAVSSAQLSGEFTEACEKLKPYIGDTVTLIDERLRAGQTITAEGAQAFGLDINRGKYPYVTSSDTLVMGLASGLGLNHKQIGLALGVAKAIQSKVGGGKMVTQELDPAKAEIMRGKAGAIDYEAGKSTGRTRDVGYLDLVLLRTAARANGLDAIILNKIDCLQLCTWGLKLGVAYRLDGREIDYIPADPAEQERCEVIYEEFDPFTADIRGETRFDKLPKTLKRYIHTAESYVGVPFAILGTGPANHEAIIER